MMELQAPDNARYQVREHYIGKSTDTKPVSASVGSTLFLTDTLETYVYSTRDGWKLSSSTLLQDEANDIKCLLSAILHKMENIEVQISIITDNHISHTTG